MTLGCQVINLIWMNIVNEIGELATGLQAKLLRVLQENTVEPVGAEKSREADVRLIAATNVSLEERVAAGTFRDDLYYRLKVVPINVPSLRERTEDIALLAGEFVRAAAREREAILDALHFEQWLAESCWAALDAGGH